MDQLTPHTRRVAATCALGALLAMSACTPSPRESHADADPSPSAPPATTATPTTSVPTIPDLPEAEPGKSTISTVSLRSGGTTVGNYSIKAGELSMTMLCTGGTVIVHMEPVTTSTVPCDLNGITPARNVIHLGSPKDITISVDAPETARWNLRIEQ